MQRFGVEIHLIKKHTFFKILKIQITHEKENVHIPEHTHPLIPVELSLQEQQ